MMWLIGQIALRTGLGSLLASLAAYALLAALAGGGIWAWSAHKYSAGYSAGELHEKQAWEEQRRKMIALAEADRARKQAEIDRIEADYLALQERLNQERAEAALAEASRNSKSKDVIGLPREVGRELNKIGRW